MSAIRYQVTECTPSGYGRRFHSERLGTARDIMLSLGGQWRVERQWHSDGGKWYRDGGRAVWFETAETGIEQILDQMVAEGILEKVST